MNNQAGTSAGSDAPQPALPDNFTKRAYQDELVARAVKENIVCALGTGTGKTYIAVKVIQELQEQLAEEWDKGGMRTVFVVPSVPLVEQQSRVLRQMTGLPTGAYHGSAGVDEWTLAKWTTEFQKNKILVMVHDIFKMLLSNAILEPKRLNLIILDECHHASEKHPYREIMRLLHGDKHRHKPRILGLTASVINIKLDKKASPFSKPKPNPNQQGKMTTQEKLEAKIKDLEQCMGATVWTSMDDSLIVHGRRAEPAVDCYDTMRMTEELDDLREGLTAIIEWIEAAVKKPTATRHAAVDDEEDMDEVVVVPLEPLVLAPLGGLSTLKEIKNHLGQVQNTLLSLGPWCAYQTSGLLLEDLLMMRSLGIFLHETTVPVHSSISTLQVFGSQLEMDFGVLDVTKQNSEGIWDLISPKARRLIELLDQFSNNGQREDFCCIVFVKERYNAWALHSLLQLIGSSKSSTRHSYISSGFCVGQLTESGAIDSSGEKPHLSLKQLRNTLDLFRKGTINVLVSTDVVEEGFDVRECNLIIRFDQPQNYRSYVQSRGRARAENSHFIMMIESRYRTAFENQELREFQELDEVMKRHCYDRTSPTAEERDKHFDDEEYPPFRSPYSSAIISMDTALVTLQRYLNTLPNDNMTSCLVYMEEEKVGKDQFICTAHLPRSAAIKDPVTSPVMKSKVSAKKAAALLCCKKLFEVGELDPENLLPWPKEKWREQARDFTKGYQPEVAEEGRPKAGTKKRQQIYAKQVAKCFTPVPHKPKAVRFLYEIRLTWTGKIHDDVDSRFEYDPSVVLGLVSRDFLPTIPLFPLYIGMREYTVDFYFLEPMELDEQQVEQARSFHTAVFEDVLQLEGLLPLDKNHYDTLFVVALKDGKVDWKTVNEVGQKAGFVVKEDKTKGLLNADEYRGKVVVTTHMKGHKDGLPTVFRHHVMDVREDLTPLSPQFDANGEDALTHMEHVRTVNGIELQHAQQPMLALRYCSKGLHFLHPKPEESKEDSKRASNKSKPGITAEGFLLVAAELCQVLPVTSALYFKLRLLPSILHRLHSFANVSSLYERLRRETGIGRDVPAPLQWQPFPHAYLSLYDHPVKAATNIEHSVKRLALDSHAVLPDMNRSQTPAEESKENTMDTSVEWGKGFFFGDYTQKMFYKAQQKRKKLPLTETSQVNQISTDTWSDVTPVVTRPVLPVPPGCYSRLVEPPFYLDAEFLLDPVNQPFPELTDLLASLTLNGVDEVNLERLETMGDAFLKMSTCVYLFLKYPAFHEGKLSSLRGDQVSNQRLYRLAKEKGLASFVRGQGLDPPTMFLPPGFTTNQEVKKKEKVKGVTANKANSDLMNEGNSMEVGSPNGSLSPTERNGLEQEGADEKNKANGLVSVDLRVDQAINDKCLADVMEALIGVVLVKCGCSSALHFMNWLGLTVLPEDGVQIGSGDISKVPSPLLRMDPETIGYLRKFKKNFMDFEEEIGYKFRQPAFLLEAFTHNSFYSNRFTDCYQRLEFIGDAVLDFLITRHLYDVKPPDGKDLSPGELTDLRSALVNNKTFSLLATKHKFHINIKFHSPKIFSLIQMYVDLAQKIDPTIVGLPEDMLNMDPNDDNDEEDAYEGYEEAEDPKTLGDVFESVAGAIFLDSGFSLDAVWKVYWNLMRKRIEYCVQHRPKNPVRVLLEENPGAVDFQKATILSNNKVQIQVSVRKEGFTETVVFTGVGNNHRTAKCSAAREALNQLGSTTATF